LLLGFETAKIGMSAPGVGQSTFFPRRRSTSIKPKLSVTVATGLTVPTACATWAVKLRVKERITWSRHRERVRVQASIHRRGENQRAGSEFRKLPVGAFSPTNNCILACWIQQRRENYFALKVVGSNPTGPAKLPSSDIDCRSQFLGSPFGFAREYDQVC
jgi:hypothetical protein